LGNLNQDGHPFPVEPNLRIVTRGPVIRGRSSRAKI
jgi:hypothetical protein